MTNPHFSHVKRLVVKLGSNVITAENNLNVEVMESISRQVSLLMDQGREVILVSSGAMAAGIRKMGLGQRPAEIPKRQAVAAIGQPEVMNTYETTFGRFGKKVAQMLLTSEDLNNRTRYLNTRNALNTLMEWQVVPVINENDTIMVEEIKLGDNDNLAAMIALLMDADLVVLLTDIDGLYDKDPRQFPREAKLIEKVTSFEDKIESYAGSIPGSLGTGGMLSKIRAARKLTSSGIPMVIARGDASDVLLRLFQDSQGVGTHFLSGKKRLSSRKCWILHTLKPLGTLILDAGACEAVMKNGKSLLPSGIIGVEGNFAPGAAVSLQGADSPPFAVGLVNYSSGDIERIKGMQSSQVASCLGNLDYDEVIHRDNLVIHLD